MILKWKNINFSTIKVLFLEDVDIKNVLVSNKISSAEKNYKYFIGYLNDGYKIKTLYIILPKNKHVRCFLIEDNDFLNKYNTILNKVSANIKKEFDGETFYNKKFFENQLKFYSDEPTDFHDKEVPKVEVPNYNCLPVISLD